ncbi:MAG: hypothetical protein LCI00_34150 [Chloroflexi bacterium]|nr:hypothetical protein [Chloroflexota bacterium]MCC6897054.1 hypothetical protein [Anaerolineae bacterium]
MPITNYAFQERVFSAKETGDISAKDAEEWAAQLAQHAQESPTKIVALVDALEVKRVAAKAVDIFSKASFTPNLIAVVVATNNVVSPTATNIGLLGRRNQTLVVRTLQEAHEYCAKLLVTEQTAKRSTSTNKSVGSTE